MKPRQACDLACVPPMKRVAISSAMKAAQGSKSSGCCGLRISRAVSSVGPSIARQTSAGSISLQAAISPCTEATDLANIAFSASSIGNSITRSTPPAPITAGTPT